MGGNFFGEYSMRRGQEKCTNSIAICAEICYNYNILYYIVYSNERNSNRFPIFRDDFLSSSL